MGKLFLAFPFGWWVKDGRWRSRGSFFAFASSFALSFLLLPLPLSNGLLLPLPLPLAMSGSGELKSRISIERNGSVAGSSAVLEQKDVGE